MKSFLLSNLEKILNKAILLDPNVAANLTAMSGKVCCICFTTPPIKLNILFTSDGLHLLAGASNYDAKIESSLSGFINALITAKNPGANSEISFSGDMKLINQVYSLFRTLDIDWEEQISHLTGDSIAHSIGILGRKAKTFAQHSGENIALSIREGLQEELQLLPIPVLIEEFLEDVDQIRHDVDRLALRIEQLMRSKGADK